MYKDNEGAKFMINIFEEIVPSGAGSIITAKRNYYAGRSGKTVSIPL